MAEIALLQTDITTLQVDAIVNAANSSLLGGGGVDGAIHHAAGKELYEECYKIPQISGERCPTGEVRITNAYQLPCKKIIHTVGPVYHGGKNGEAVLLENCYTNSLRLAAENGITSIAFPNISTGVYGYPKEAAAKIAVKTVRKTLEALPQISSVVFICFDNENFSIYQKLLDK